MLKSELIKALAQFADDEVVVCADENGGWDNIEEVKRLNGTPTIIFGGGASSSGRNLNKIGIPVL